MAIFHSYVSLPEGRMCEYRVATSMVAVIINDRLLKCYSTDKTMTMSVLAVDFLSSPQY